MGRRMPSALGAIMLGSAAVLAGCNQGARSAAPPPSSTSGGAGAGATAVSACSPPAWLATAPPSEPPAGYAQAAAPLQGDQAAVEDWGRAHATEFSASWIALDGPTGARLVVALPNTAEAPAALKSVVSDPDRLVVCQHRHSRAELDKVAGEIGPAAANTAIRDVRVDAVNDAVAVDLAADKVDQAAQLHDKYGDAAKLTVGWLPYPLAAGGAAVTSGACRPLPDTGQSSPLSAELVLGASSLERGGQARGVVHVRNTGAQSVELRNVQPLDAVLLQPGSQKVVGALAARVDGADTGGKLGPGETLSLPVMAGTDSCDPALGYTVPPGSYEVVVVLPGATAGSGSSGPTVVSERTPITVTS